MATQQSNDAISKIFGAGGEGTTSYQDIVNQGYRNLGQPYQDNSPGANRAGTTSQFITNLAATFADRVTQKTGQLPTEDQIRQFVSQNATAANASKFETGNLGADQMNSLADYHIQSNPDLAAGPNTQTPQQQLQALPGQVAGLYDQQRQNIGQAVDAAYAPVRKNAIEDEAALGRLRSPASIPNIGAVDAQKAGTLSNALAGSYGNQTNSALGIGQAVAQMGLQNQQFGQQLGLANRQFGATQDLSSYNQGLQQQQLGLAGQLGRDQAGQQSNDGIAGAGGGALTGALIGSKFGPIGTGIGALGGGLLGYFGSKR